MAIRNRRARRSDYVSPTCPPGWAWLLAGILIGIFISFLFYLREIAPHMSPKDNAPVPPLTENRTTMSSEEPFDLNEGFKFEPTLSTERKTPNLNFPITVPGRYLLQVGSFQNEQSAKGLKAHLASLGIPAHIEKTMLNETGRWHRVQVGPFTELDKLNQTHALLADHNISVIARKF
jgi:cell division septation protein DedD